MKKTLKFLAIDFDGTLVESNEIKDKAFDSIFSNWPEHRETMMKWHLANDNIVRQDKFRYFVEDILAEQGNEGLIEKLTTKFSELSYRAIVNCRMVHGAREFLENYVSKVHMFLVSFTPHNELNKILKARFLTKYFKEIQGAPINKVEVLKNVISVNLISPDEMIYIGDSPEDQQVAKTLGCQFIGRKSSRKLNALSDPVYPDFVKIKEHLDRFYVF